MKLATINWAHQSVSDSDRSNVLKIQVYNNFVSTKEEVELTSYRAIKGFVEI